MSRPVQISQRAGEFARFAEQFTRDSFDHSRRGASSRSVCRLRNATDTKYLSLNFTCTTKQELHLCQHVEHVHIENARVLIKRQMCIDREHLFVGSWLSAMCHRYIVPQDQSPQRGCGAGQRE